ncbi:hypothetical protein X971_5208 (plasmid) [Agrobacterium tumefaciens LBA4213 (Ach5)]|nr:hypothetical protein X971_5208 [Agrobacterium tumefaciens LBA4213 (Ach5)]
MTKRATKLELRDPFARPSALVGKRRAGCTPLLRKRCSLRL